MPIHDIKKFQTCANLFRDRVTLPIMSANQVAGLIRQAIIDNDLTEYLSPAEQTALTNFVNDLSSLADSIVVQKMEDVYVESHRCNALTVPGVND